MEGEKRATIRKIFLQIEVLMLLIPKESTFERQLYFLKMMMLMKNYYQSTKKGGAIIADCTL